MRKRLRLVALVLFVFCSVYLLYPQQNVQTKVVQDFELEGTALFQCECTAHACPCQKNGAPNHGTCEAGDFVHVHTGSYGNLHLDGLNAVVVGNLVDKNAARHYATLSNASNGPNSSDVVMTTWHAKDGLEDAIDFFATCAMPTDGFASDSDFRLMICVANQQ